MQPSLLGLAGVVASLSLGTPAFAAPEFLPTLPETPESESAPLAPAEKTYEEYWADVGLKFTRFSSLLTKSSCTNSLAKFSGCFAGFNAALRALKLEVMVYPEPRLKTLTVTYRKLRDFGGAVLIEVLPDPVVAAPKPAVPFAELKRQIQERHRLDREGLATLFATIQKTGKPILMEELSSHVETTYLEPARARESYVASRALNGYLSASIDPHTYVQPRAYLERKASVSEDSYVGIGVIFSLVEGRLFVTTPMRNSPALRAGLRAKDEIIEIDGKKFTGDPSLAGAVGSTVVLTVKRGKETLKVTVIRDKIVRENVTSEVVRNSGRPYGLIRLEGFDKKEACADVYTAIQKMKAARVEGLILDLRDNGGGFIVQATCIAGLFIGRGKVVMSQKAVVAIGDDMTDVSYSVRTTRLPLVTLINSQSASASEVLSGALQDHDRTLVMGERSFGKATVQGRFNLKDLPLFVSPLPREQADYVESPAMVLLLTIARFYLPGGWTNQIIGVKPDVEVFRDPKATTEDQFNSREEDLYANSLPPLGAAPKPRRPELFSQVKTCMKNSGLATKTFSAHENDAISPDFQVLAAEDALSCMTQTR